MLKTITLGIKYLLIVQAMAFGASSEHSQIENKEYRQDLAKMKAELRPIFDEDKFKQDQKGYMKHWMAQQKTKDLNAYEKFSDGIINKWKNKNKEYHARLILEACQSLHFYNDRDRSDAIYKKYVLSALADANDISIETELKLASSGMFNILSPKAYSPKDNEFVKLRENGLKIYLHAWRRLLDAVDPTWDPNDTKGMCINVPLPPGVAGTSGMAPDHIKDPVQRAKYKSAIEANRQRAIHYGDQRKLHQLLKAYPKKFEEYISQAYSKVPYNNEELAKYLNDYKLDEDIKARIVSKVSKNIER